MSSNKDSSILRHIDYVSEYKLRGLIPCLFLCSYWILWAFLYSLIQPFAWPHLACIFSRSEFLGSLCSQFSEVSVLNHPECPEPPKCIWKFISALLFPLSSKAFSFFCFSIVSLSSVCPLPNDLGHNSRHFYQLHQIIIFGNNEVRGNFHCSSHERSFISPYTLDTC